MLTSFQASKKRTENSQREVSSEALSKGKLVWPFEVFARDNGHAMSFKPVMRIRVSPMVPQTLHLVMSIWGWPGPGSKCSLQQLALSVATMWECSKPCTSSLGIQEAHLQQRRQEGRNEMASNFPRKGPARKPSVLGKFNPSTFWLLQVRSPPRLR